jgi:hypothetical protein
MIRLSSAKTAVLALVLVGIAVALSMTEATVAEAKRKPTPTPIQPTPTPDFLLRYATYGYTDRAYVVRGGLPTCSLCADAWEPRFIDTSSEACFYGSNHFTLTSLNGFEGTVYIGASSIAPNGVTSEIPNTLFIPRGRNGLGAVHTQGGQ